MTRELFSKLSIHLFLLLIISVILPLVWLPKGTILAGGDVGIPVFSPKHALQVQSYSWSDANATGNSYPVVFTAVPFYVILSGLNSIEIGTDFIQKLLFFSILFGGSLSIYFLALQFSFKREIAFIAALFYLFNLTSLSVWQRGVHNAMLMLFLAPFSLLILSWGIKYKRYSAIVLLNIISLFFSYVFGSLGHLFSLWFLWIFYIAIVLISEWQNKLARKFILTYFFILVISWIGTNLWWIINLISSSSYTLGQFNPTELKERGSDVLVALKPYHEPSTILRGLNKYSLYVTKDWGDIYLHPLFILLSWIPTIVIFSTTFVKSNYKSSSWRFLFLLTTIILVISKGVNPPLGFLNKIPYDLFPFLAPLRNPYEKVGILLTIPFSLLFALGVYQINSYLKIKKLGYLRIFTVLTVIVCLTVLVWPLWLGDLWSGGGKKYIHSIPPYYGEASIWMAEKTKLDDTRILHLPLAWWESIDYNWGYTGIEPSQYFFEGSSIGYHIGVPSVDSRIRDLLLLVHSQDTQNLQKAFASLNIGWVIIHNETLFRDRMLEPPERINAWLATNPYFLEKATSFGPLDIWRVKDQYRAGHFYFAGKLISLKNTPSVIPTKLWNYFDKTNDSFIADIQTTQESVLEKFVDKILVFPKSDIVTPAGEVILNEESGKNLIGNTFGISDIDVRASYQISFDVLSEDGSSIFLTIAHDNDPLDIEGRIKPAIVKGIKPQGYLQWQKAILNYSSPLNATSAQIGFIKSSSTSAVKNLKVEKILAPDPILEENRPQQLGAVNVKWNKVNPTLYELNLSQQSTPYIMVFSETFHPLWKLTDYSGKTIDIPHFSINGYANGWLIEKPLPPSVKVEFVLQKALTQGIVASVSAFILSTTVLFYLDYKRRIK